MSELQTNFIALPATTRSIKWCQYEYQEGSSLDSVIDTCRQLLDSRTPCVWRPRHAADNRIDEIESVTPQLDAWDIWVFHAAMAEEKAAQMVSIPKQFHTVESGEIPWTLPVADKTSNLELHRLFSQALDNLIDRALLPLSIIRFGFRQWIALDNTAIGSKKEDDADNSWQTVPAGASTTHPTDDNMNDLLGTAANKTPASDSRREFNTNCMHIFQFSVSLSSQGILLQPTTRIIDSVQPIRERQQVEVRIAPSGMSARIVSFPDSHLGVMETEAINAWSRVFGYSRQLLVDEAECGSSLVWIVLENNKEPMLYPRRLVLVDRTISTDKDKITQQQQQAEVTENEEDEKVEKTEEMEDGEHAEEGEEGEADDDEEGEIADALPTLTPQIDLSTIGKNSELDAVVSRIQQQPVAQQDHERFGYSLADIKSSMAQFQIEKQAEEAAAAKEKEAIAQQQNSGNKSIKKRQRSGTRDCQKSATKLRKKASAATRPSNSMPMSDEDDTKPLADGLVGVNSSVEPISTKGSSNIDSLFGDGPTGDLDAVVSGNDGAGMEFGSGDDMGLGMGMGNNIGVGSAEDGFGSDMFGVTDDDFSFFDNIPLAAEQQQQQLQQHKPTETVVSSVLAAVQPPPHQQQPPPNSMNVDNQQHVEMNEFIVDDVFDSFFDGNDTSTNITNMEDQTVQPPQLATIKEEEEGKKQSSVGMDIPIELNAISSPPPPHISTTSVTVVHEDKTIPADQMPSNGELATPVSLKMTPAQSTGLRSPTPTMRNASSSFKSTTDTANSGNDGGSILPPASIAAIGKQPLLSSVANTRKSVIRTNSIATPQNYTSISTPYDDIGCSSRSWLHGHPGLRSENEMMRGQTPSTPAVPWATMGGNSLNPVSWVKRVSARRLQQKQRRQSTPSTVAYRGSNRSVRRLKGWLANYEAKLSYATNTAEVPPIGDSDAKVEDTTHGATACGDLMMAESSGDQLGSLANSLNHTTATAAEFPSFTTIANHSNQRNSNPLSGTLLTTSAEEKKLIPSAIIKSNWVPQWIWTSRSVAVTMIETLLANQQQTPTVTTWRMAVDKLSCMVQRTLLSMSSLEPQADSNQTTMISEAIVPGFSFSGEKIETQAGKGEHVGAKIGGLLGFGSNDGHRCQQLDMDTSVVADANDVDIQSWLGNGDGKDNEGWAGAIEIMADWAAFSPMVSCWATHCNSNNSRDRRLETTARLSQISACLSTALVEFWGSAESNSDISHKFEGLLSVDKLLSLVQVTEPNVTTKYGGFVVKKRKSPSATTFASSERVHHHHPLSASTSSSLTEDTNGILGESSKIVTVSSGLGTIEPLLEVQILVGAHGQEDVAVPSSSSSSAGGSNTGIKSRDAAESLYIKRWRYAQKLAVRARYELQIASGEIVETEEGEEKEEGEEGEEGEEVTDNTGNATASVRGGDTSEDIFGISNGSVADGVLSDPDSWSATEPEDALRRVCIETSPMSVRWWAQMHMRPIGASKDVRWVAFVPPCLQSAGTSLETNMLDVNNWCQSSREATKSYLGDVGSAYQACHFGTHKPLGLLKPLDGVFTQLSGIEGGETSSSSCNSLTWSGRLRYEAERLGHLMAHAWYTSSPHSKSSTTTLVLYMMVPHSEIKAVWLALSEAAYVVKTAFAKILGNLAERGGHSTNAKGLSDRFVWPSLVVHPLSLDHLVKQYYGGKTATAEATATLTVSAQEAAMTIYNRCPAQLPSTTMADMLKRNSSRKLNTTKQTNDNNKDELVRCSGYYIHCNDNSSQRQQLGRTVSASEDSVYFVHRAYMVSMPCLFPLEERGDVFVSATMRVSPNLPRQQSSQNIGSGVKSTATPDAYTTVAAGENTNNTTTPLSSNLDTSSFPSTIPASPVPTATPPPPPPTATTTLLSGEARVKFKQTNDDDLLYSRLVGSHPLRTCDNTNTLHCIYTVCKQGIAVCWCDERGEYLEHDLFALTTGPREDLGIDEGAASRIWRGCQRYQELFGGHLRVILGQWKQPLGAAEEATATTALNLMMANKWVEYFRAWQQSNQSVYKMWLYIVNICTGPGLFSSSISNSNMPASSAVDMKRRGEGACLILQGSQPLMSSSETTCLDESLVHLFAASTARFATGHLVLNNGPQNVSSLCVQLIQYASASDNTCIIMHSDDYLYYNAGIADAKKGGLDLIIIRSILKQYYQLAWIQHAYAADAHTSSIYGNSGYSSCWPMHFLPLPISVVNNIRHALESLF